MCRRVSVTPLVLWAFLSLVVLAIPLAAVPPTAEAQTYSETVSGAGPVSYWRLGETSGTVAADAADANPGTYRGGYVLGGAGALAGDANSAVRFTGSSARVDVASRTNLNFTGNFTVEAWARPDSLPQATQVLVQKGRSGGASVSQYQLGISSSRKWRASVFVGGSTVSVSSAASPSTAAWSHVAMVRSGGSLSLYVNGTPVATRTFSGTVNTTSGQLAIGRAGGNSSGYFKGAVDEVAVYAKALTGAQVAGHNDLGITAAPAKPTASFTASPTSGNAPLDVAFTDTSTGGPTAWSWDFGDGSASTEQSPVHRYDEPGVYSVSLTVTGADDTSTVTKPGLVTVSSPPPPDLDAPVVALTSPVAGSTFTRAESVPLTATASDNVAVSKVEFYAGSRLVGTDTTAPYSASWALTADVNGSHTLTATAHDAASNVTTSEAVQVSVAIPEPIAATVETAPVPHSGDAADDPAIWVNPDDPGQSTVIGTDKQGGLGVYGLDGTQLFYYAGGEINNVDIRYGFPLGGQSVALVVASNYDSSNSLRAYRVDPATRGLVRVDARTLSVGANIYGLCLYHSPTSGEYYAFNTTRDGRVQQWRLFDNGTGKVDVALIRTLSVGSLSEGCAADDEQGNLYVAEEDVGIWRYGAEPGAGSTRVQVDRTGSTGHLTADVEGLTIYYAASGAGYLIASSQGSNDFAVYRRDAGNEYVTRFAIAQGAVDAVTGTDGIDVANLPLGTAFSDGMFVAGDYANGGANQNFKLVPWRTIAAGVSPTLAIDTTADPRR